MEIGAYFENVFVTFLIVITFFILILAFLYMLYGKEEAAATTSAKTKT